MKMWLKENVEIPVDGYRRCGKWRILRAGLEGRKEDMTMHLDLEYPIKTLLLSENCQYYTGRHARSIVGMVHVLIEFSI